MNVCVQTVENIWIREHLAFLALYISASGVLVYACSIWR